MEKIQIRLIQDFNNNKYYIYDYMTKDKFGLWRSRTTYFSLEDALNNHKKIEIEDITK
ncbi:MAG: hypothetical protein ACRCX2_03820 [Paraclostridium sp.]